MVDWPAHMRRVTERIGEDVLYSHAGGPAVAVRGVFSRPYTEPLPGMASSSPAFEAPSTLLPAVTVGDSITWQSVTYTVREIKADPVAGMTRLELEAP